MSIRQGWNKNAKTMITGFEKETAPLSEYEKDTLLPLIIKGLNYKVGKNKAISNRKMVSRLRNSGYDVDEVRMRKLINHIRVNGLVPCLIATSKGYYIATDEVEVQDYIDSLQGRENAIRAVREAMERQIITISQSQAIVSA